MPNLNLSEMAKYINDNVLPEVMNDVGQEAVKILQAFVQIDVYDAGNQRKVYAKGTKKPTRDLINSVVSSEAKITKKGVNVRISHDPKKMRLDKKGFIHGSKFEDKHGNEYESDVRKALPEIINDGKAGNHFGNGWWRRPRPYFTGFKLRMKDGSFLYYLYNSDVWKKHGITIKKI